ARWQGLWCLMVSSMPRQASQGFKEFLDLAAQMAPAASVMAAIGSDTVVPLALRPGPEPRLGLAPAAPPPVVARCAAIGLLAAILVLEHRQRDREHGRPLVLRAHANLAAVLAHDLVGDAEPERARGARQRAERREQLIERVAGLAHAIVDHVQHHERAGAARLHAH